MDFSHYHHLLAAAREGSKERRRGKRAKPSNDGMVHFTTVTQLGDIVPDGRRR